MGFLSGVKKAVKPFVNITGWMSLGQIQTQTKNIQDLASGLLKPTEGRREETFEQALVRLKMTEKDVQAQCQRFKILALIFTIISALLLIYWIYLLYHRAIMASLGCLGITLVMIAQAFRYHFWYYQVKERRLGCTFKEWLHSLIGSKK